MKFWIYHFYNHRKKKKSFSKGFQYDHLHLSKLSDWTTCFIVNFLYKYLQNYDRDEAEGIPKHIVAWINEIALMDDNKYTPLVRIIVCVTINLKKIVI